MTVHKDISTLPQLLFKTLITLITAYFQICLVNEEWVTSTSIAELLNSKKRLLIHFLILQA